MRMKIDVTLDYALESPGPALLLIEVQGLREAHENAGRDVADVALADEHGSVRLPVVVADVVDEYSVWNPPTSSDSASARSKGARLVSATPEMK